MQHGRRPAIPDQIVPKTGLTPMRILVVIPHYSGPAARAIYGSQQSSILRLAALSEQIVALHRHFGSMTFPGLSGLTPRALPADRTLKIIIVTMENRNVLPWLDIDPSLYTVEYYTGDPLMMSFETQRIMRDNAGQYDIYSALEDDLIIHDPEFFNKVVWFNKTFGDEFTLQPHRYELSKSKRLAKYYIEGEFQKRHHEFKNSNQSAELRGTWNHNEQFFSLASNPHAGCCFVTNAQLDFWMKQPSFYDRNPGWIGPLESAATRSLAMTFNAYRADRPNAAFLEIEHYGIRYAKTHAPDATLLGESPILTAALNYTERTPGEKAQPSDAVSVSADAQIQTPSLATMSAGDFGNLLARYNALLEDHQKLKRSKKKGKLKRLLSNLIGAK
jgi:hypothetical protein